MIQTNYVSEHNRPYVRNDTNIWILGWQQEIGHTGVIIIIYVKFELCLMHSNHELMHVKNPYKNERLTQTKILRQ